MTDTPLRIKIIPGERLLTAEQFHRLADVPPEVEWFRNIRNPSTRRAYQESIRISGVFTPPLEQRQRNCRLPAVDTISRRAAGACHRGCEFGSAAARCAPRFVHCICWRLAKRLLMTAFTVDSARHDEMRSPARNRSP